MFSFKYALFCIVAGLLAGWSFDKKNDNPILGGFVYLIIFSAFYVNFPYDSSWAFVALIEVLAGHGLYKMGFGNFLGDTLSNQKSRNIIEASKAAKKAYDKTKIDRHNKDELGTGQAHNSSQEKVSHKEDECTKVLNNKGYAVLKTHEGFTIYIKPIIMGSIKGKASNVSELCELADKYNQIDC